MRSTLVAFQLPSLALPQRAAHAGRDAGGARVAELEKNTKLAADALDPALARYRMSTQNFHLESLTVGSSNWVLETVGARTFAKE